MKIGIDIRTLMDKEYSGVSEFTLNLLDNLFKLDHSNQYILFYNSGKDVSNRIPKFNYENVNIESRRYPNKIFNYFLQKLIRWPKIDQLLGVDLFFMPHINFISLSSNSKKILVIHDLSFMKYGQYFSIRKKVWHFFINTKKIIPFFDQIVTVSENSKSDIVEITGIDQNKIKVIHSGVEDIYKPIDDQNLLNHVKVKYFLPEKFILYLGTVEPRKNIDGLIAAYDRFRRKNPSLSDCKLVIAGRSGWKTKKIIQNYNFSPYKNDIVFLGYIEKIDKPALYNLSSVFVYPSFYEGFGFPVLEAMACGTPVITSNISSLPEITNHSAFLINPYNTTEISEAIKNVLTDSLLSQKLLSNGLNNVKDFKWPKTANEYLKIFNSI